MYKLIQIKRRKFRLQTLCLTIPVFCLILALGIEITRWQQFYRSEHRGIMWVSSYRGTYTMESVYSFSKTGKPSPWIFSFLQNHVARVDLSSDAWPLIEKRSAGSRFSMVSDDDLVALDDFPRLRSLDLHGSNVTDKCAVHLVKLKYLEELDLTGTSITESGLRTLRSKLPNCQIHH